MRLESSQRNRHELVGDHMRNDGHRNTTPSDGAKTRVVNFFFLFGGALQISKPHLRVVEIWLCQM